MMKLIFHNWFKYIDQCNYFLYFIIMSDHNHLNKENSFNIFLFLIFGIFDFCIKDDAENEDIILAPKYQNYLEKDIISPPIYQNDLERDDYEFGFVDIEIF